MSWSTLERTNLQAKIKLLLISRALMIVELVPLINKTLQPPVHLEADSLEARSCFALAQGLMRVRYWIECLLKRSI